MRHRSWIDLVLRILPFAAWKDALIRGHVERCPECGRRLATADEARRAIVGAESVGDTDRLQREVAMRIAGLEPKPAPDPSRETSTPTFGRAWRWVAVASGMIAAVIATAALVLFFRSAAPSGAPATADVDADQIQIHYVRIADEPAQTFIFKPHDSDVIIIWAGKTH